MTDLRDLPLGELHHVLHAAAGIDEADAVELQTEGGEGRELLLGRFLIGRFVGEAGEDDAGHGKTGGADDERETVYGLNDQ